MTAHISAAGYASFEAEASFTVARRLVAAPTLGDTGGRTASSVYDGEEVRIAVTGYDGALMDFTAEEGTQLVMEGQQLLLAADAEGTYVLQVSLKDIYNYGWADLAEGEQIAGDIALAWEVTLAMHSLLWLIILLFILLLILIALLVVFAKKDHDARARIAAAQQGAESGADGAGRRAPKSRARARGAAVCGARVADLADRGAGGGGGGAPRCRRRLAGTVAQRRRQGRTRRRSRAGSRSGRAG